MRYGDLPCWCDKWNETLIPSSTGSAFGLCPAQLGRKLRALDAHLYILMLNLVQEARPAACEGWIDSVHTGKLSSWHPRVLFPAVL